MTYEVTLEPAGYSMHGWGVVETDADGTQRTLCVCGEQADAQLITDLLSGKGRDSEVGLTT